MRAHPAGPRHGDLVAEHAHGVAPDDLSDIDARIWAKGVNA